MVVSSLALQHLHVADIRSVFQQMHRELEKKRAEVTIR